MTLYEPKWSVPGDGTNTEPGEYEAWLEFKALVEAGHLVPVEPDYDEAKDALDLIDAYLSIVRNVLGIGETP